ncbi:tRNA guanosine(34) transglycosylase Tgt [Patescibacteria group bacterium]
MLKFFNILSEDKGTEARLATLKTLHGTINTPAFIPDATYGAVKHLSSKELQNLGLQILLGNIYHLGLRPGTKTISKLGGLHSFMNWQKPIITDSGGFQVFSLVYKNKMGKVLKDGIVFKDHLSGKKYFLTPKKSISMQLQANSDILMVLDYPVFGHSNSKDNQESVALTTSWARDSKLAFDQLNKKNGRILMAIIQGANSKIMRKKSFQQLESIFSFPGYGFGGPPLNKKILKYTANLIPENRVRYVMGGGTPKDILESVSFGWDLFDCVIPTRNARHGLLYTFNGELRISQVKYKLDRKPIEKDCPCEACTSYSRAYLRHLFKVSEPLAQRLLSLHNLTFYIRFMEKIRESIKNKSFSSFYKQVLKKY